MIRTWALVAAVLLAVVGQVPAQASVAESERLLEDARARLAADEINAAIIQLRNALLEDADNVEARRLLGELYLRVGEAEAAAEELARVLEAAPDAATAGAAARAELILGRAERALAILDAHAGEDGGAAAATLRAQALLALGRLDAAGEATARALAEAPLDVDANLVEARRLAAAGERTAARSRLAPLTEVAPDDVRVWALSGRLAMADLDFETAERAFARAAELAPQTPSVALLRSRLAQQRGDLDGARARIEAVLEREPENPTAIFRLAELQLAEGDPETADQTLRPITDLIREDARAQLLQGTIKARLGQYAQARRFLGRYLSQRPDDAATRQLLAAVALEDGAARAAMDTLAELAEDPESQNVAGLVLLSSAQLRTDAHAAARATLARIAGSDSANDARQARHLLAILDRTGDMAPAVRRDLLLALDDLRFGRVDAAAARVEAAVAAAPSAPETRLVAADVRLSRGETDAARATLRDLLAEDPGEVRALQRLIRLDLAAGDWADIEGYLDAWLEREPDNVAATALLVRYLNARDRLDEARAHLEERLRAQPTQPQLYADLASILAMRRERTALADLAARAAAEGRDGNPAVLDVAIAIALDLGEPAQALALVEDRLARTPDDVGALLTRARVHYLRDDVAAARADLARVRGLEPANAVAANSLVELDLAAGDVAGALAFAEAIAALDPQLGAALKSRVLFADGRPQEAVAVATALQAERPSPEAARLLFLVRRQAGFEAEAIAGLRSWVQRNPVDVQALDLLSQALILEGEYRQAGRYLEQALRFVPSDPTLLNNLAWLRHEQGRDGAETLARRALQLAPNSPQIADTLGWILVQEGDVANGLALLREAARLAAEDPNIRYHLAYALHADGDRAAASEVLRALLADHRGDFLRRPEAEALLANLEGG